jgi:prepilin-type N-terminal cleavage/methylation domain-containing protein
MTRACGHQAKSRGFSLVELLIAATIMLLVMTMVYTAFIQTRKVSVRNQMDADLLQNARIGLDEMTRAFRMIGYRRDEENRQVALIEAAPFQCIFNADIYANKSALPPGMSFNLYDATTYTAPLQAYTTHAETIRWTLDSSDDGLVDKRDTNDNREERLTSRNRNDMVLIREIMHSRSTRRWRDQQIALSLLGPYDADDQPTGITPLFQYWLLNADDTFSLLGDLDGNDRLEGAERYFRSITAQDTLQRVRRIQVTVTTESDGYDPFAVGQHRRISLSSEVSLRNVP